MSKVILITGTSSGLGRSCAIQLAQAGHIVYAGMRNLNKAESLKKLMPCGDHRLNVLQLDVVSSDSIRQAVDAIIAKEGRIDCLINNAGVGYVNTLETTPITDAQDVMDVNFLGIVRTCKAVIPHMRQANSGQIINVSSIGGLVGQPFNEIYCASKFAVEGLTESMASYLQPVFNIKFTVVEPGGIESEFINNILSQYQAPTFDDEASYQALFSRYLQQAMNRSTQSASSVYQSCDEVAKCVIDIVNREEPPLRIRTSEWANDFCRLKTMADPNGNQAASDVYHSMLAPATESA